MAISTMGLADEKCSFMADKVMPMSQAEEGYEIFNSMKAQKVIFEAQK